MHLKLVIPCALDWRHSHLTLVQPFPSTIHTEKARTETVHGMGVRGASWVHTDECRICSRSCFHNEVKGNMKCSKVPVTPSALWSRTSSRSSRPAAITELCLCKLPTGPGVFLSKSAWFLIMFGLAFFECILFQGIASTHFSFVFTLNMLTKNHYYS